MTKKIKLDGGSDNDDDVTEIEAEDEDDRTTDSNGEKLKNYFTHNHYIEVWKN